MKLYKFSITARLTTLFALTSAVVLLSLGVLIAESLDSHFANEDYASLAERIELIEKIGVDSTEENLRSKLDVALRNYPGFIAQVSTNSGEKLYATGEFDFSLPIKLARTRTKFGWTQEGKQYRGIVHWGDYPTSPGGKIHIILGLNTAIHEHFMDSFTQTLFAFVFAAAAISGILGLWAARKGLAPIRAMAARAKAVSANQLHERMPVERVPVEMAELATTLNAMLERLQRDFQRLSDFSSDIAHELRTPITNMMTQTHVTLTYTRTANQYQEILASNAEEMQRLARMISDMLFLAKTENGLNLPNGEKVDLAIEVDALIEFYEALAEDNDLKLHMSGQGFVFGDKLMIRRALSNLLSNAVRYAFPSSTIEIAILATPEFTNVSVANKGVGITQEQIGSIFDRFYRADKSRTRPDSEGVGLGLSITKAIMLAHGGKIEASSVGQDTTFTLRFRP